MFLYGVVINLILAGFNLIPIPPLDGSHVVKHLLPPKLAWQYQRFGRYGIILLLALLWFGNGAIFTWLMQPAMFLQTLALGSSSPFVLREPMDDLTNGTDRAGRRRGRRRASSSSSPISTGRSTCCSR